MRECAQTVIDLQPVLVSILAGERPYDGYDDQYAAWAGQMMVLGPTVARYLLELLDDGRPF